MKPLFPLAFSVLLLGIAPSGAASAQPSKATHSTVKSKSGDVSGEDLEQTIMRYVTLYNTQFPQSALRSRTPVQPMKAWHKSNPELFLKKPGNHPGCDNYLLKYQLINCLLCDDINQTGYLPAETFSSNKA